ncbi:DUF1232 domain-containing protein [Bacillus sp. MHSD_36]|uniref:YkvA family protein n=1 Tax=unclassified Bacillus (in: firmicutes) TaxID=185979 RepID=UPI0027414710|nr:MULTISPECIES: DUF1232 domain-containing protein [unclassified Bacillus (in: firmicutes)]MDP7989436.1 DUF1232 domain-containing protein [Bacillus sp. MHSD_36]MDR4977290.1 DUF1232 domain-containing protein [Bacillus sp. MHSD_37]
MEKQTLWKKFKKSSANLGKSSVYESIILYYTLKKSGLPTKAKLIIIAALSYYVWAIDFIPDIAAIIGIGLLDDVLAIAVAHKFVMRHADAKIRKKSKIKMESLFTSVQA